MELIYCEREGGESYITRYRGADRRDVDKQISEFTKNGYEIVKEYKFGEAENTVFLKGADLALFSYYPSVCELSVVTEPNSGYISYLSEGDEPLDICVPTKLTYVDILDPGLSVVIRLPDGRFVIIDGGWENDSDADRLMETLRAQTFTEKPIIAAWIMTHPHVDHFRAYIDFERKYYSEVEIKNFIYNFPDPVIDERIPRITHGDGYKHIGRFEELVRKSGVRAIRCHTGQVFEFSGVRFETLSSPDDTYKIPIKDFNAQSLVFMMFAEGQKVLHTADVVLRASRIGERYGSYLKSDIMQVTHHFFDGGDIKTYDLVSPEVIVIPSTAEISFSFRSIYRYYRNISEHLLYNVGVKECFALGKGNVELDLPYSAPEGSRERMYQSIEEAKRSSGATSWYFDGITKETAEFTFINAIWEENGVRVDLLFEDTALTVEDIKFTVPPKCFKKMNVITDESVNPEASKMNKLSLLRKGVPEGVPFAVHIKSDFPIVVVGDRGAVYHN